MKHSVLIVDDEYYICENIKLKLEHLQIPEIGDIRTCYSGQEALTLCQTFKPELVITDIKMGLISGIELIHILNQQLFPVRFLVLSGFDNYEYVRDAFREGVVDYLLKPLLTEQLNTIIRAQCDSLQKEFYRLSETRSCRIEFAEKLFLQLTKYQDLNHIITILGQIPTYISHSSYKFVILSYEKNDNINPNSIINLVYDFFDASSETCILCGTLLPYKIGLVLNTDSFRDSLAEDFNQLIQMSAKQYGISLAIAHSHITLHKNSLYNLYYEAENSLIARLIYGYGNVYYQDMPTAATEVPNRLKQLTHQLFEKPDLFHTGILWREFLTLFYDLKLSSIKRYYHFFTSLLYSYLTAYEVPETEWDIPNLYSFHSLKKLEEFFYQQLLLCIHYAPNPIKLETTMDQIKQYIDEHYSEPLTLTIIAERFFISYSYLSKIFHERFDRSFQSYLISTRMDQAERLLHNPELTIQEIALSVGYTNVFNFSRCFKKYFGISPNYYRK